MMLSIRDEERPWKTDLARKSAQRRETVLKELEELIKKAPSFEEALKQSVEMAKRKFARYTSMTVYVADGENLAVLMALDRPEGPERVASDKGPLAKAAHKSGTTIVADLTDAEDWHEVGLKSGSAMVAPVRTDAGLWAILEVWSDFRAAFSSHDERLLARVADSLARKTPAA